MYGDNIQKTLPVKTCDIGNMYFYPGLVYGKLRLRNRAEFRSEYLDIANCAKPWLFSMYHYRLIFGFCHTISPPAETPIMIDGIPMIWV
jgi:hypothetical protein